MRVVITAAFADAADITPPIRPNSLASGRLMLVVTAPNSHNKAGHRLNVGCVTRKPELAAVNADVAKVTKPGFIESLD